MRLNIVLVEPRIASNTGNIARTCAATGTALHIVKPAGFFPDDARLKRAGLDYWHFLDLTWHESLDTYFENTAGAEYFFFSTKAPRSHSDINYPDNAHIVFGREDKGLPESLLASNPERCVRIPMISEARSLNLSNAAAIAAYEVLRQWNYPELSSQGRLREYDWESHIWPL